MPTNNPLRTSNSIMAHAPDFAGDKVVLLDNASYGGFSNHLNETWTWDGTDWTRAISAISSGPLPLRADYAMAYDGYNVLMYGGRSDAEMLSDTWTCDGAAWTKEAPVTVPFGRYKHQMAFLATTVAPTLVMFGGNNMNELLNQTWVWDGNLKTWTLAAPAASPPARKDFAFSGGPTECVLFGGKNTARLLGDTWTWDGTNWAQNTPTTPPAYRAEACMAYDTANGEWVMFGGRGEFDVFPAETWTLNAGRTAWTKKAPATSPPPRVGATMCYDSQLAAVIMTGGTNGFSDYAYQDTWSWDGTTWTQL